ncbi:MAG: DUF997 family protein [Oscillospiraceae bacterium]|nr:DUF997 family protein [Oscillospiraceae bacterium]
MEEKNLLESTDYDVNAAGKADERMETGKKDALFLHILGWVFTIIATIWMYAFGTGDPTQMKYFLGMPMWISGAIVIYLIMFVIGMVYIIKWDEFPLTARVKKNGGDKK